MTARWTRRALTRSVAGSAGALAAARLGGLAALAQDAQPTTEPINLGDGGTEITIWVQDFGPRIQSYRGAAQRYIAEGHDDIRVTVQPLSSDPGEMMAKILPAIATGTEADIMMGYTNFYVATDVSRLFLRLDEAMGGLEALQELFFPQALGALRTPEGTVYALPQGAGLNGCAITVDRAAWAEAGIEYASIRTWDDLMAAARELTVFDGSGTMTRAGFSNPGMIWSMYSWVWQLGGEFYDEESGRWSFATPEGEAALKVNYDIYNGESPVCSFDLVSSVATQQEDMVQGRLAAHMMGAYSVGNTETLYPDFDADGFPTPPLANAVEDVISPAHNSVVTLSRRLAEDETRRNHCLGIVRHIYDLDAQLEQLNTYSGSLMQQNLYSDPRIGESKYGEFSKMISEATFPRARYQRGRVANLAPAETEFQRAVRGEISIQEALQNADAYLNEQEQLARERVG